MIGIQSVRAALGAVVLWLVFAPAALAHGGHVGLVDGVLEVVLSEWSLGFQTLEIPAGPITVHVANGGQFRHNLHIQLSGGATASKTTTRLLRHGEEAEVTYDLPPGEYEIFCSVPGHKGLGMVAKLVVTARY